MGSWTLAFLVLAKSGANIATPTAVSVKSGGTRGKSVNFALRFIAVKLAADPLLYPAH
jgi:hypothetical protein